MTTIIRAADAAAFLSLVPRLLGFVPRRSVVLIPFAEGRSIGGMRFDLPSETDAEALASSAVGLACRVPRADGVAAIVYGDDPIGTGLGHEVLARALLAAVHASGLRLVDALRVGPSGWGSYLDAETPPGGRPLPDADASGLPASGRLPDADQLSGAALADPDPAEAERVADALRQLDRALATLGPTSIVAEETSEGAGRIDPRAFEAACALDDLPALFERALSESGDAYAIAALLWCLARPAVRDVGLGTWLGGVEAGDAALGAQLRGERGPAYPADLAERILGEGPRPDPRRLEVAVERCRHAAAHAPRAARPGVLSVCAWLSWALGRSTHAEHYGRLACEIDPEHGLSRIVLSMVQTGHLPDWAFRSP